MSASNCTPKRAKRVPKLGNSQTDALWRLAEWIAELDRKRGYRDRSHSGEFCHDGHHFPPGGGTCRGCNAHMTLV